MVIKRVIIIVTEVSPSMYVNMHISIYIYSLSNSNYFKWCHWMSWNRSSRIRAMMFPHFCQCNSILWVIKLENIIIIERVFIGRLTNGVVQNCGQWQCYINSITNIIKCSYFHLFSYIYHLLIKRFSTNEVKIKIDFHGDLQINYTVRYILERYYF